MKSQIFLPFLFILSILPALGGPPEATRGSISEMTSEIIKGLDQPPLQTLKDLSDQLKGLKFGDVKTIEGLVFYRDFGPKTALARVFTELFYVDPTFVPIVLTWLENKWFYEIAEALFLERGTVMRLGAEYSASTNLLVAGLIDSLYTYLKTIADRRRPQRTYSIEDGLVAMRDIPVPTSGLLEQWDFRLKRIAKRFIDSAQDVEPMKAVFSPKELAEIQSPIFLCRMAVAGFKTMAESAVQFLVKPKTK